MKLRSLEYLFTMKEREEFIVPLGFLNQHGNMRQSLLEANLSNDTETSKQVDSSRNLREESYLLLFCSELISKVGEEITLR
jgi:hypothetical protein